MVEETSIKVFLKELAGKTSTPGGGSAAAISGAMGSALVSMVAQFTIDKAGYEDVTKAHQDILQRAESLRERLFEMINEDIKSFNQVMASYSLEKSTDAEKKTRLAAIQSSLKEATDVPLDCAKLCAEVMELSKQVAESGNKNVISDAGVAVLNAYAGLKSAALNVYINIAGIKDSEFSEDRRTQIEALLTKAELQKNEIYELVKSKL